MTILMRSYLNLLSRAELSLACRMIIVIPKAFIGVVVAGLTVLISVGALATALGAELPKVPFLTNWEERNIVGEAYFLNGVAVPSPHLGGMVDEVAIALHTSNGPRKFYIDGRSLNPIPNLLPHVVEIRKYDPTKTSPQLMPLVSIVWDADYDGLGDYVAIPAKRINTIGFRIFLIPENAKPDMGNLTSFLKFGEKHLPKFTDI